MSSQFQKGKSGNPRGRPVGSIDSTPAELKAILSKLKKITPDAVELMITAMQDPEMGKAANLKYAEKIFAMYMTALKEADRMKAAKNTGNTDDEDEEGRQPAVVLSLQMGGKK
ncbi:DUF5681 domain-containing protein [Pseudomonas helleri]|uniref:DUF5681 domain-containing protein n=1 Tax=Pseudomonas helleri TaxID=1608996 RepID=UPI00242BB7DE|nr:DUF5681 domain-containing protein [Pseudomonas helleri]